MTLKKTVGPGMTSTQKLLSLLAALIVIFLAMPETEPPKWSPPQEEEAQSQPAFDEIHVMAQGFIKKALKAPSTARFPSYGYQVFDLGGNTFMVESYVDSQNGFGAQLRTPFKIVLKFNGGDIYLSSNWTVEDLAI